MARWMFLTGIALLGLAGCNTPEAPPPEPASLRVTPQSFQMPEGEGCSGSIARYRAVQDNDLAMGHVARSVYNQIKGEIEAANQACGAGHDAQAISLVAASRARHGYPAGT